MDDTTHFVLPANCSPERHLSARSPKSYRTYVLEVVDSTVLASGDEVLALAGDKELMHIVVGHPRHDAAMRKKASGSVRYVRKVTAQDAERLKEIQQKQDAAIVFCKEQVRAAKLPIHLVNCELSFSGKQYVFYFTADTRVDFRGLVSTLSRALKAKIQMWQIGSRDETRFFDTIGMCGRELCCNCFLKEIKPVSLKCARVQNLSLNPSKITGVCGKLMCCLRYETYEYGAEAQGDGVKDKDG
ncbi:MAG: regulatory iron-sulfur-containing complex subunit RicT [Caldisericota bacterium]|jgi:cell fate regulator YaaT (PSP1 superfamily)|nr:regulatory iron-sulfur-containing complex subunit RicT [Caldisericota bacterium]